MPKDDFLSLPPKVYNISKVNIPRVSQYTAHGNIPVFEINKRGCGIIMIDIVFRAGRPQESQKMVSASCAAMLREGAGSLSSAKFSEEIDFLGATITCRSNLDYITIKAVCLKEHLDRIAELLVLMVSKPRFDKVDFSNYCQKNKERLKVQVAKNDIKAYRLITEAIYGKDHPYGYNSSDILYDNLHLSTVVNHYEQFITAQNCQIFLAGELDEKNREVVQKISQNISDKGLNGMVDSPALTPQSPEQLTFSGHPMQTSVRIGRRTFNRNHKDFNGLNFLSNILGGYFGSRLVKKIREEMGLTYGIYSMLDSYVYGGDFIISTEVANENVSLALSEIFEQMDILRDELVSNKEIELAKNYMLGNYLNLFDGPFNSIRAIKSLALARIPLDNIDSLIKSSLALDAIELRDLARKYFDRNDFWKVIVGTPE